MKFVSRSFSLDYLKEVLLVNQLMDLDPDDPCNTKPAGKEHLDVEDLMFKRVTKESLAEYADKWVSSDDDDSGEEDSKDEVSENNQDLL